MLERAVTGWFGVLVMAVMLVAAPRAVAAAATTMEAPASFAPAVRAVQRAVVSVVVPHAEGDDDGDDDTDQARLLSRIFDALGESARTLGAAVVIDRSGIALTSLRTLRGFQRVEVLTVDGTRLPATVAGRDERTDLAILRIVASTPLDAARLGDSDTLRVGDWVLALGSPYGFEASVSAGIVSGRARPHPDTEHEESIQTDAAINPGSVGGPLVDTRGDVVGILVVPGPKGAGVGFAVTSNLAKRVAADLLAHGRVMRGWLGITAQQLTPELASAFGAPPGTSGLLTIDVAGGSPADRAGLARGAIVLAFNSQSLRTPADLESALDRASPGERVTLRVQRAGRTDTVAVVIGAEPVRVVTESPAVRRLGVVIEPLTPEAGVRVAGIGRLGPAASSGMLAGDLLREIDGHVVRTVRDAERLIADLVAGRHVAVLLQRGQRAFYVVVTVSD